MDKIRWRGSSENLGHQNAQMALYKTSTNALTGLILGKLAHEYLNVLDRPEDLIIKIEFERGQRDIHAIAEIIKCS